MRQELNSYPPTFCTFACNRERILMRTFKWKCEIRLSKRKTTESQRVSHYSRIILAQGSTQCTLIFNCLVWKLVAKFLLIFKTVNWHRHMDMHFCKNCCKPAVYAGIHLCQKSFLMYACHSKWDEPRRKEKHLVANLWCSLHLIIMLYRVPVLHIWSTTSFKHLLAIMNENHVKI